MLLPIVIIPGQLHLEGWVKNELEERVLMAVSNTRYTNNELALEWLKHFD